jgi:uncharacterized membrane protein YvbJ
MYREIIEPTSQEYILKIPKEYLDQKIEILILPFSSHVDKKKESFLKISNNFDEIEAYSNHSANLIEEWKDSSEDDIWR